MKVAVLFLGLLLATDSKVKTQNLKVKNWSSF